MLRISWIDNINHLLALYGVVDVFYDPSIQAIYDPEGNEIILVRNMIHSKRELARILFHEFLHYLICRLKLPERLNQVIDDMDLKWQIRRQSV